MSEKVSVAPVPRRLARPSMHAKAQRANEFRCKTLTCVLENPKNLGNVGAIIRNCDALGVGKLCVIDESQRMPRDWHTGLRTSSALHTSSVGANKWVYVKVFDSTADCLAYLARKNTTHVVTSPHIKGHTNTLLHDGVYTQKQLAVWFGNESRGISPEAVAAAKMCVQIAQFGFVESMNLACSTAVVLHEIVRQRHAYVASKET